MGHSHSHGAGARAGARHRNRLLGAFGLLGVFIVVEVVAGVATNSLALISDAGHMLTDVIGMGIALAAIQLANQTSPRRDRTFGLYRLEILAALANAVLLFGVVCRAVTMSGGQAPCVGRGANLRRQRRPPRFRMPVRA